MLVPVMICEATRYYKYNVKFFFSGVFNCLSLNTGKKEENGRIALVNPLSPNSDQQQFSPNDIHTLS